MDDTEENVEDLKKIEAIFFISGRFLSMPELISLSGINPIMIKELLIELKNLYEKRNSAICIVEKNGLWKMDVKKEYSNIINKFASGQSEFSKSEQQTLAIIAYKQPIKQSVIIKIRSNKAYDEIKKFLELGLIRKKRAGRTYELSLSDDFYNYFNIADKKDAKDIFGGI